MVGAPFELGAEDAEKDPDKRGPEMGPRQRRDRRLTSEFRVYFEPHETATKLKMTMNSKGNGISTVTLKRHYSLQVAASKERAPHTEETEMRCRTQ